MRKEFSADGRHRHLAGVYTNSGVYYSRRQVVDSINAGNLWVTSHQGASAAIHAVRSCSRCTASPYIETNPDSTGADNLENLPERNT